MTDSTRPVILLVEDSPADQELTRRAFLDTLFQVDLRVVNDGEEALDYLHRRGAYRSSESSPTPNLVLLDLNLPRMDGREVLSHMRQEDVFAGIPVVILTSSDDEREVKKGYELGCNSYVTKPTTFEGFVIMIRNLLDYWLDLVRLPTAAG